MPSTRQDITGFYRLALDFRLISTDAPSIWADAEILHTDMPDEGIIDLALTVGQSIDRVIHALRQLVDGPGLTNDALRLFGGLLLRRVGEGQLTTVVVAHLLYKLTQISDAEAVFGGDIYWLDELYEPWGIGSDAADKYIRDLLGRFSNESLPPI